MEGRALIWLGLHVRTTSGLRHTWHLPGVVLRPSLCVTALGLLLPFAFLCYEAQQSILSATQVLTCPYILISFWRPIIHVLFSPVQVK